MNVIDHENDRFVNARGSKKMSKIHSVEEQYSPEELIKIQNAVRFTHQMFGNAAEKEMKERMEHEHPDNNPSALVDSKGRLLTSGNQPMHVGIDLASGPYKTVKRIVKVKK